MKIDYYIFYSYIILFHGCLSQKNNKSSIISQILIFKKYNHFLIFHLLFIQNKDYITIEEGLNKDIEYEQDNKLSQPNIT